jgi:hypothetical protein
VSPVRQAQLDLKVQRAQLELKVTLVLKALKEFKVYKATSAQPVQQEQPATWARLVLKVQLVQLA